MKKDMNNFEEILQLLLSTVESNPDMSVEEALKSALEGMDLNPEGIKEIEESFKILDAINEKSLSLANARKERKTRHGWLTDQLTEISELNVNNNEDIIPDIDKGTEDVLKNKLTQNN